MKQQLASSSFVENFNEKKVKRFASIDQPIWHFIPQAENIEVKENMFVHKFLMNINIYIGKY